MCAEQGQGYQFLGEKPSCGLECQLCRPCAAASPLPLDWGLAVEQTCLGPESV